MFDRLFADAILPVLCFVLFCLCLFCFFFIESAVLRSVVLRYGCAPSASRTVLRTVYVISILLFFVSLEMSRLFNTMYHDFSLFVRIVRCTLSFRLVFVYLVTTGCISTSVYVILQSVKNGHRECALL